jgi:hypothetical protein
MKFKNLAPRWSARGAAAAGSLAVVLAGAVVVPAHGADDDYSPRLSATPDRAATASGWYSGKVTVEVKATEPLGESGVRSLSYYLTGASAGGATVAGTDGARSLARTFDVVNEGVTTVHVNATDWADNPALEYTKEIRIDTTLPDAHIIVPANGDVFSVGQTVSANFSCSDDLSGWASCGGTYASGERLYTGAAGEYTVWVTAIDNAGNRRDTPVTYTVVDEFDVRERPSRVGSSEPRVGTEIQGSAGVYSPTPDSLSCHWLRGDVELAGGFRHTIVVEDLGRDLYFQCTAGRSGIPDVVSTSDPITPLLGRFPDRGTYKITGEGRVGNTLILDYLRPSVAGEQQTPSWTRDGVVIPGTAGQAAYNIVPADLGHTISAVLRSEAPGYEPRDYPGGPAVTIDRLRGLTVAGAPTVSGSPQVGRQLTTTVPTFTPAGPAAATPFEVAVEWLRDGTAVGTGSTYRLTAADAGHRMTARVIASGAGFETARVDSAASGVVVAAPGGGPGQQPGTVASKTRLKLKALGKGRVRATITVVAGRVQPNGTVTIRRGAGKARTVTLKNGRAVVVLKKQRKGSAVYTVSFAGTTAVSASKAKARTRVR